MSFGVHAFTRDEHNGDTPDLLFMDGGTRRTFCVQRYAHSLHLPAAIVQAATGDVCLSQNTLIIDTTLPGLVGPYLIAVNVRKFNGRRVDARIDVRSAYHRPNLAKNLPKAKLAVVISNVINGKITRWTKK